MVERPLPSSTLTPRASSAEYTPVDGEAGAIALHSDSTTSAAHCPFPNCPHCLDGAPKPHLGHGVMGKCGVTGKKVYEPMSTEGAKFYALIALLAPMYGVPLVKRLIGDKAVVIEPDDEDIDITAKGAKRIIERRMPQLAAHDDVAQFLVGMGGFTMRAWNAKGPA